jgi:hypothetical protein
MQRTRFFLWALVALGCSGRSLDVGTGSGSSGATQSAAGGETASMGGAGGGGSVYSTLPPSNCTSTTPLPSWPDPNSCVAASAATGTLSPLVGTWNGYIENGQPPWDQLTLTINGASVDGGVCGTLVVGAGPPPPPATDPNVGYPPSQGGFGGGSAGVSGARLTLLMGTTDGARVRFSVAQAETWRSWCQLQPSFNNGQSCACLPPFSTAMFGPSGCTFGAASSTFTVDCGKLQLCSPPQSACACNASGCDASNEQSDDFDLRFSGDMGEGSDTLHAQARTIFTRPTAN